MQDNNNKTENSYFKSVGLTIKGLKVLLGFSFVATIIAFSIAFCEHRQYTELVDRYDDALVRISQCEVSVSELMNETSYYNSIEYTTTLPLTTETTEYTTAEYEEHTINAATDPTVNEPAKETQTAKPHTTKEATTKESTTKESTTKVKETSGAYYVTQSGKKYHVASCSYLSKSKIAITMDKIRAEGYSPCSRCIK